MRANYRPVVAPALVATVLGVVYINSLHLIARRKADESMPYGSYTSNQIIARTVVLVNRLCPEDPGLRLSPSPTFGQSARGEVVKMWDVVCTDSTGRDVAFFTWNAVTGNLLCYSQPNLRGRVYPGARINASEAASAAQHWLGLFNPGSIRQVCRPIGDPTRNARNWVIQYTTRGGDVVLTINAQSGQPIFYRARYA
jgi:hypothetical protein